MKLIILAAGDAFELDGYSKLLINHPREKKNILELYSEVFDVKDIIIVVGFKAIEIMNKYFIDDISNLELLLKRDLSIWYK